nr:glycosyltransferase [uncultured Flavobacterium sp.]
MRASIVIVSKNRKEELLKTLKIIGLLIDKFQVEVLVFLDGCTDDSEVLMNELKWVSWFVSAKSIGASAARQRLYPFAKGELLIGLDDDAHPLTKDFVSKIEILFQENATVGVLAFEEVKGVFESDSAALEQSEKIKKEFLCSEFIGCGFAIRKSAYLETNGFPVWIDIYGEESCVAIEVLAKGFDILYTNQIKVNHRVNKEQRKLRKQNYFRFGKQLKNSTYYFLVYYPYPLYAILKLYWHNLKKYALTDWEFSKIYFKTIFIVLINVPRVLRYRNPVDKTLIIKMRELLVLKF